jgi:hypothetical protein
MQINKPLYNVNSIYPYIRSYNTKYWEQLQKVMDASKTRAQNIELRKRFIQKQNKMNYQNEYDRLRGELSHLAPELQKYAVQQLMDRHKLETIGQYEEPVATPAPAHSSTPTPSSTPRNIQLLRPRRTREQIEEDRKEHALLRRELKKEKIKGKLLRRKLANYT